MTPKEMKTTCQSGDPATAWVSEVTVVNHQLLAAAKHDRKAPARPSLPRSAPLGEERTDHGVRAQRAGLLARTGHRFLFVADRSCRLKRDAKINLLAITDSALHAAGIVGCRANFPVAHFKRIVVLRTPHPRRRKTRTYLESFGCRYAQHRFSQIRIELVENRFTESRRNAA